MYLIMFVDSAMRWMRPYSMRRKSETTAYVQKFITDVNGMGRPKFFRTDYGGEFISRDYVGYCDSPGIRREYTAPGKPQQNAVVEMLICRAMKGGHTGRLEIGRLFPNVDLGKISFVGSNDNHLYLEAALWASDCFKCSATKANTGWRSPHEVFFGRLPDLQVIPSRHDAGGKEHLVRCPRGQVFLPPQLSQPLLIYCEGSQELHRRRALFQRHRMDGPPHACPVVTAAGGRRAFSGLSGRRRADNDGGVHQNIDATVTAAAVTASNVTAVTVAAVTAVDDTAVTAVAVTAGNVTHATVTAVTSVAVAAVMAATVAAGNVTVVTAAAVTAVTTATPTAVSVAVIGGASGVWPYPLEDDSVFRHGDDAPLGNAGEAASPVANENRRGFQSQR